MCDLIKLLRPASRDKYTNKISFMWNSRLTVSSPLTLKCLQSDRKYNDKKALEINQQLTWRHLFLTLTVQLEILHRTWCLFKQEVSSLQTGSVIEASRASDRQEDEILHYFLRCSGILQSFLRGRVYNPTESFDSCCVYPSQTQANRATLPRKPVKLQRHREANQKKYAKKYWSKPEMSFYIKKTKSL